MERLSHNAPGTLDEQIAALGRLGEHPASETAARIVGALGRADTSGSTDEARQLDEAVLRALGVRPDLDLVLEELDPERLAGVAERLAARLLDSRPPDAALRRLGWLLLDLLRRRPFLRRIARDEVERWAERTLRLVDAADYTVGPLFRGRAELYGSKTLFELPAGHDHEGWSWRRTASRVELLGRALLALDAGREPARVAILAENRIEVALLDLACLSSGIVNVMVPANASESDVGYALRHSGAGTVIVSDREQLRKVLRSRESLTGLERIITLERLSGEGRDILTLDELISRAESVPRALPRERAEAVRSGDLATIMYTSGTTGTPKGIQFSHRNIVFKRFARALALPEIGEEDVFLCFLPLYHTFGRFLELLGSVFWGARYCFLEDTSRDGLAQGLRRHRPTVFISVPKKWMQLRELIAQQADPETASDEELLEATRRVTGGRLVWGLSAAGHLDAEIFRFFGRQGVELLSGFGMTEATGGITMTSPGEYEDGSLGPSLPGIEVSLAEDGEMLMRGPYVMLGYLDPPLGEETAFDREGWFHTGDLMERGANGHYRLIDRKKEIYKNIKGETIAPQRVENHFRDFDSVRRVFLVGDHRDYNTLLIYPNPDYRELDFRSASSEEVLDHFRSLVVSVNKFLAPYERIVDFAIIDRDLDLERGELTPKGTPRRKTIEENFAPLIRQLYRRARIRVGGVELELPDWLFQILGLTARDIRFGEEAILLRSGGTRLALCSRGDGLTQVGSCLYRHPGDTLNLGSLLTVPRLWLGNDDLVSFVPLDTVTRQRASGRYAGVEWAGRATPYEPAPNDRSVLASLVGRAEPDLLDLDLAARMLGATDEADALVAVRAIEEILRRSEGSLAEPARLLLARLATGAPQRVLRRAFQVLAPAEKETRFKETLERFTTRAPDIFDTETQVALTEARLTESKIEVFIDAAGRACSTEAEDPDATRRAIGLLRMLATYGSEHPVSFRRLRSFLYRMSLFSGRSEVREAAARAACELQQGFRSWIGPTSRIAVDPERGREYGWDEVVQFDDGVPEDDRRRLMRALERTALVKEAVFLFSTGVSVRLSDIVKDGVKIRLLGSRHGKSVYRITVQTRFQGSFDLAVNLNHDLTPAEVEEEIQWLILSGDPGNRRGPLVEDFGGYWPEHDLWSEEFIAGETLDRAMDLLTRREEREPRIGRLWPFMARSTLASYVDFWNRSGRRLEIADPSMSNIIVPTQDFLSGVRIVSLSRRRAHEGLLAMLRTCRREFIEPAEELYPLVRGLVGWDVIFSAIPEVVGEAEGLELLEETLDETGPGDAELARALRGYIDEVREHGFVPLRLFFAVERYRRWHGLSGDAAPQARARTLREIYETYGLERLVADYPELRVRFFTETVFLGCSPGLAQGLLAMIGALRAGKLAAEELIDAVDDLRAQRGLREEDDYFLARLSHPYLRPQDAAGFVRADLGGRRQSEIVVSLEDSDGQLFSVRHALNPKEVERLLRLFLAAKLDVSFRMEHRHLVAINERGQIIGGIYYEIEEGSDSAHLEKIVVADRYRGKGVANGLMSEFVNRLRATGIKTVTTGFFRQKYFQHHGFRVDKSHAGLVRSIEESADRV